MGQENNLPVKDAGTLYEGQDRMYSMLRSQYPDEADLALEYFQNDGFLSRNEIEDIVQKQKIHDGALRASLNEKVKQKTGRSFLEGKEVKMVSAIMLVVPFYLGLLSSSHDMGRSIPRS